MLTLGHGPLAPTPPRTVNYRIDGPGHKLFFDDFPRRIRAMFGGEVILDSTEAKLLYETGLMNVLYIPDADIRDDLLIPTDHTTHCPFKGDASYWTLRVGDQTVENMFWAYPNPIEDASWLRGYRACYANKMDSWFDEDEEVAPIPRDPYHRVDARASSRHVRVTVDGAVVAETRRPMILSETGLPNRYYIPREDVRAEVLEPSATHAVCPYKGTASYHSVSVNGTRVEDAAWFFPNPLESAIKVRDHLAFSAPGVRIELDGKQVR